MEKLLFLPPHPPLSGNSTFFKLYPTPITKSNNLIIKAHHSFENLYEEVLANIIVAFRFIFDDPIEYDPFQEPSFLKKFD